MTDSNQMELPELTSSVAGSLARTSVTQESAQDLPANDQGYGQSSPVSLARYDRATSSSKMSPPSSAGETSGSDQLTAAYVAGLIDGEGCLWVQNKADRWFTPRCDMGMSEKAKPVLEMLTRQFGGSLTQVRKRSEKWEAAWRWAISGKKCLAMLEKVSPHLVLKAEQARLMLSISNEHGATTKALVAELNRKGPSVTPEAGWFARHVGGRWLTPQRDLVSPHGWEEYSETWPRSGMTRNGIAYQLPTLAHLTGATESGLWPTPSARDGKGARLPETMAKTGRNPDSNSLPDAVEFRGAPGRLNPLWVEWLMGYPVGWTGLKDSETQSSPKSPS